MILLPAEPDLAQWHFHRKVSEHGLIEVFVWPVNYGHRVRAGFVGSHCCVLDWCGGKEWKNVERLYSLTIAILAKRDENRECFAGLPPHSCVKPFYNDLDFVRVVGEAAGDFELVTLERVPTGLQMLGWDV